MTRALAVLLLLAVPALARDNGQWAQADPKTRQWFREQTSPRTGARCCSDADGVAAEEDIRNGHYWTRWKMRQFNFQTGAWESSEQTTEWTEVPDDVVIHNSNPNGAPVVWWWYENGKPAIRCYAPGGGV